MQLEWIATGVAECGSYPFEVSEQIDTRPLIRAVYREVNQGLGVGQVARRFHSTLVEIIVAVCQRIGRESQLDKVVLSGGVFMNALLTHETCQRLTSQGFRVFRHRLVPPGDGGLSLGQLAIAARHLEQSCKSNP